METLLRSQKSLKQTHIQEKQQLERQKLTEMAQLKRNITDLTQELQQEKILCANQISAANNRIEQQSIEMNFRLVNANSEFEGVSTRLAAATAKLQKYKELRKFEDWPNLHSDKEYD